jgi:hypothetical protein
MKISNASGKTTLPVRWARVPGAMRYASLSRSIVYRLISEGKIRSVVLRDKDKLRGIRLVSLESIDRLLESIPEAAPVPQEEERDLELDELEGYA